MTLKAGTSVNIVQVLPDGVMISRGEGAPFKISKESLTSTVEEVHAAPASLENHIPTSPAPTNSAVHTTEDSTYIGLHTINGALIPSVANYLGKNMSSYDEPVNTNLISQRGNFGYSQEDIDKYFNVPLHMALDETGLDKSYIKPAPAPGVHPRVIFNPEDVPLIKSRLSQTKAGQAAKNAIWKRSEEMFTGSKAKYKNEYELMVSGDPKFIETYTLPYSEIVKKYPNEKFETQDPKEKDLNKPLDINHELGFLSMYESFRCLIDDDQEKGKKIAAIITTLAKIEEAHLKYNIAEERRKYEWTSTHFDETKKVKPTDASHDWRVVGQVPSFEGELGLAYDFAYKFMTPEQRDIVRSFLAHDTAGMSNIGCETLRTLHSGASNWVSWSARLLFPICSIEGEAGFDPLTEERAMEAQINFMNTIYPSGEAFEGWSKNFVFIEHLVIMAKRGKNILGCTNMRASFNNYYIAAMNPWGKGFTFYDSLSSTGGKIGRNADALIYHTLFPKDVAGDFIYRNQIEEDYERVGSKNINTSHPFNTMNDLCCAIFASDMMPNTWDEEHKYLSQDRKLTYFSEDTGTMITRSSWDTNSLYLNYISRSTPGGHVYCDRSHFNLYALGRYWSIYHYSRQVLEQQFPSNRSVLLADDKGASLLPGKCESFIDNPLATFTSTDIKKAWDYQTQNLVTPPANITKDQLEQIPFCYNDFKLHPSSKEWMNYPTKSLPNWYSSEIPIPNEKRDWYKIHDVKKAFRTAGIVRGEHPYAIIVDNLQLDDATHKYDWGMILDDDLSLGAIKITDNTAGKSQADIILNENLKSGANNRHLLVKVLSCASLGNPAATVEILSVNNTGMKNMELNKLHIKSESVSPEFKILLYPYKEGDTLPTTSWNADYTTVTISFPHQTDIISFTENEKGKTCLKINRNGKDIL